MTGEHLLSTVYPHRFLRVLGLTLLVLCLGLTFGIVVGSGASVLEVGLVTLLLLPVLLVGWHLMSVPVRVCLVAEDVVVAYWPTTTRIPRATITEVLPRDQVDGYGFGYGYRWEGRGRRAVRLGGPMVTIVHDGGRLGVSVQDPDTVVSALTPEPPRSARP
ncbi:hypothetical protein [Demetria terragena]|uniref:hypothetical protein n=1 Tax=Demetria terragena TaxID=63959 RepID=UPI00036FD045|nr:hypothetical protein [Demetria terragena]